MINETLSELQGSNQRSIEAFRKDLTKIRTGRAHVGVLDGVRVDYFGSMSPLNQVASVSVPDPRQICIKPWDRSLIPIIERAILQADLGLNPSSDGEVVRLNVPPLTTDRRQELIRVVKRMGEDAKVGIRGHRRDTNETLKELEKEGMAPKDDVHRALQKVQEATDNCVGEIDTIVEGKEQEILED
jgi:ribosome recycling factor